LRNGECGIETSEHNDFVIKEDIMNKEESISISNHDLLKTLKGKYLCARRQLQQARSKWQSRRLQEYVDDLKMDLAWALLDCGKHEEGLALYLSVSGKHYYRERKYSGIGRALTEMKHYDEARRILEKGLKEFPESCALWTCLGILLDILGDHFEALKCFEAAIEVDSKKSSGPLYNKALALMGLGSYTDAASIIDRLIEEYPEEPKYLADRGNCALETGYPREALQYFEKAMAFFTGSPDPHTGVSIYTGFCSSYLELGMKREAMEISLEGLKRFPDQDPALYHNAGGAFYEMGWRRECLEILKKGVEKFPNDKELKQFLKEVEDDIDDPDKGDKPPLLGFLLLMALIHKRWRKK
jgi:tetratricopeptide (TPR) repeat protein